MSSGEAAALGDPPTRRAPFVYYSYTGQPTKVLEVMAARAAGTSFGVQLAAIGVHRRNGSGSSRCRIPSGWCSG